MFEIERGNPWMEKINLTIKSMLCKTLIWFPQMFNPQVVKKPQGKIKVLINIDFCSLKRPVFASRSLVVCVSETLQQWSRWSLKERVPQWDMFPGLTELRMIGCSIEVIWTQKSNQVHQHQKPTRRHLNQRKFHTRWVESIVVLVRMLAIAVLQFALMQWRSDLNKIQEKSESQQNQDQWWISLPGRRRSYRPLFQWAPGREVTEVKIHRVQLLRKRIDRSDLIKAQIYFKPLIISTMSNSWKASLQQVIQSGMTTVLGLLKWKTEIRRTNDRGDLIKLLGSDSKSSTWSRGNSSRRNRAIRKERRNTSWQIAATW